VENPARQTAGNGYTYNETSETKDRALQLDRSWLLQLRNCSYRSRTSNTEKDWEHTAD
jgi:hypothetical protein